MRRDADGSADLRDWWRSPWVWSAAIFTTAFAVRLIVAGQLAGLPIVRTPWLDSAEYVDWARRLVRGGGWPINPPHGPGYPFFLAGIFTLFGDSLDTARLIQAFLGAVSAVLVAKLGSRFGGPRAGVIAGFGTAIYGPLVLIDVSVLAEALLGFLVVAAVWASMRSERLVWQLAAAAAFAAAVITRPTAVVFAPVVFWPLLSGKERVRRAGAALLTCTLIIGLVLVANWRVSGMPMIQAFGGMNFYLGNGPAGNGLASARPGAAWETLNNEARRAGAIGSGGQERYYLHKTLGEIRANPVGYARLLLSKALWTFQAEEVRDTHSYYFFAQQSALLGLLPGFGWLLPFALAGAALATYRRQLAPVLAIYLAAATLTCVGLVVGWRYRLPMIPPLLVLAALGLTHLVRVARGLRIGLPEQREAMLTAGSLLAGLVIPHLLHHPPSHNFSEEWIYTGKSLEVENRLEEAETSYRKAVTEDGRSEYAWDRLGALLLRTGRREEGRKALEHAIALDSRYADATYHLGLADEADRDFEKAVANTRKAVQLVPDSLPYQQALARTLVSAGRYEDAEQAYRELVTRWPDDASSHVGLAFLLSNRQQFAPALEQARLATALDPRNEQGWLLLARSAIDVKDAGLAEEAIRRAAALIGGNAPEIAALAADLRQLRSPER